MIEVSSRLTELELHFVDRNRNASGVTCATAV
jgi:hypothetical protein